VIIGLPSAFAGGLRLAQLVLIERHPKNWPFIAAMALSASYIVVVIVTENGWEWVSERDREGERKRVKKN
jgi:hypothetical protein